MWCRKCGTELPENAEFCTECGTKVLRPKTSKKKWLLPLCVVLVVALLGGGVFAAVKLGKSAIVKSADGKKETKVKKELPLKKGYERYRKVNGKIEVFLPVEVTSYLLEFYDEDDHPEQEYLSSKEIHEYNDKGQKIRITVEDYPYHGIGETETTTIERTYTKTDQIESESMVSEEYNHKTMYYYNEKDRLEAVNESTDSWHSTSHFDPTRGHKIMIDSYYYEEGYGGKEYISYEYNDDGDMISSSDDVSRTYYKYNDKHQFTYCGGEEEKIYTYDSEGRLLSGGDHGFEYDEKGRLRMISWKGEDLSEFKYNSRGLLEQTSGVHITYDEYGNPVTFFSHNPEKVEGWRLEIKYQAFYIEPEVWKMYMDRIIEDKDIYTLEEDYFLYLYEPNRYLENMLPYHGRGEAMMAYLINEGRIAEAIVDWGCFY